MVMFLLSFVKGVQIRGGESISASGFGPGGSISVSGFGPGGPILGGSKSAGTGALFRIFPSSDEFCLLVFGFLFGFSFLLPMVISERELDRIS